MYQNFRFLFFEGKRTYFLKFNEINIKLRYKPVFQLILINIFIRINKNQRNYLKNIKLR